MSTPETPPPAGGDPGPGGLSGIQRASIVLGALAVLLIVFVVLRGSDDSGDSPSSSAPQTSASQTTDSQTTASTTTAKTGSTTTGETGSTPTGETGDDSSTGTTPGSDDSTTTTAPEPEIQTVRVVDGKPQGGVKTLSFKKDDQVRFKVQSDTADEIHVHGYDLKKDVAAGGSAQFSFKGDIEGRFEVELENAGVQIGNLEVTPS